MIPTRVLRQNIKPKLDFSRVLKDLYGALSADSQKNSKNSLHENLSNFLEDNTRNRDYEGDIPSFKFNEDDNKSFPDLRKNSFATSFYANKVGDDVSADIKDPPKPKDKLIPENLAGAYLSKFFPDAVGGSSDKRTNILYYKTDNPFLLKEDFFLLLSDGSSSNTSTDKAGSHTIFSKRFSLGWKLESFEVIKARDSDVLEFAGGYFLMFKSHDLACAYFCDVINSAFEGQPFNLEFLDVTDEKKNKQLAHKFLEENLEFTKIRSDKVKGRIEHCGSIVSTIGESSPDLDPKQYSSEEILFIKSTIKDLPAMKRDQCVVVHNLPYSMTPVGIIHHFLWNFDLYPDHSKAVRLLLDDPVARYKCWVIGFDNNDDPKRFFRAYHGKYLEGNTNFPKVYVDILD
ncbi:hypothetical protein DASC09_034650 [Saccharomycopsis crataegensis]|uniref:Uncharacterized protein n=1 Tax=Saccharomycopsis crataegensis TaxID=43959 RepID=A0AAV5QP91_9ASCO|nr:hypothetical protein DASC09_034650 [Saccharomycopsis crataegensis]